MMFKKIYLKQKLIRFCHSPPIFSVLFKFIPLPLAWAPRGSIFSNILSCAFTHANGTTAFSYATESMKFLHLVLST